MPLDGISSQEVIDGVDAKYCSKCKELKMLDEFGKDKAKASGYKSQCRLCRSVKSSGAKGKVGRPRKYPEKPVAPDLRWKSPAEKKRLKTAHTVAKRKYRDEVKAIKLREEQVQKPYNGHATLEAMYEDKSSMRWHRWETFQKLREIERRQGELEPIRIYLGPVWQGGYLEPTPEEHMKIRKFNSIKCEIKACEHLRRGELLKAFDLYVFTHGVYPPDYILRQMLPSAIRSARRNKWEVKKGLSKPLPMEPIEIDCRFTLKDLPTEPVPVLAPGRVKIIKHVTSPKVKALNEEKKQRRIALMKSFSDARKKNTIE